MGTPDPSGRGTSTPRRLRCPDCGETYRDRWRCRCGSPLSFADAPGPEGSAPDPASFDARDGLWAFDDLLAVGDDPADRVTLGEGMTPLVDADEGRDPARDGGSHADPWNASFKLEYVFPTGSFKDRGATATLTRARELGVERVVEDSSGNAGAAIATYAARSGIEAEIYVPADAKSSKLRAIRRAGAEAVRIEGSRQDVTDACVRAVEEGSDADDGGTETAPDDGSDAWYASHAWNPAFFEGTATAAYEIALQRGWDAPDAVVTPLGHGTLFLGVHRGFRRLERAGWIDAVPRLYGAQAAGVAPVVESIHGSEAAHPDGAVNEAADGIQIAEPVRGAEIRAAIDATGGDALAVTEAAATRELDRLHAAGFYTEPTCAVAPAALRTLRERGEIGPGEDVVVPLTGSGLKG
ncbi:threonine synthase [Halorubrum tebenquichense]|uniref:Threonine synthase n=1 Tax=Halorubrum tebenquichense DSM 14210 TaxID=1227485 RepID=M0DQF1_9EURY|nr:threonine synthase [Halorubrum tebenquichense]ELZ37043.1 Threonine synthase [Halorubrum tebenquichense DSM 14210]